MKLYWFCWSFLPFYASVTNRCRHHYVFRFSVCDCIWAWVLLAHLTAQCREFHQTLVDDVFEVTDELVKFWRSWVKVMVTAKSYIWVSYCSGWRHPHPCLGVELSSGFLKNFHNYLRHLGSEGIVSSVSRCVCVCRAAYNISTACHISLGGEGNGVYPVLSNFCCLHFWCLQGEFTGLMILGLWWLSLKTPLPPRARVAANALGAMAVLQVSTVNWFCCYLLFLCYRHH